jgi:hypothetical protein
MFSFLQIKQSCKQSWKQSFSMLSKKELLLFVFSWVQNFRRSFPIFLKFFWWFFALEIALKTDFFSIRSGPITMILLIFSSMLFVYFATLSIRASIDTKNSAYFISHIKKILCFAPIHLGLVILLNIIISFSAKISVQNWALAISIDRFSQLARGFLVPFIIIAALFLLDKIPSLKGKSTILSSISFEAIATSLQQSITSIVAYFPLFFVIFMPFNIIIFFKPYTPLFPFIPPVFSVTAIMIINFFVICAINTFYLKVRHNNYPLFFSK